MVEEEWLATLATLDMEDVIYTDYSETAMELESLLRQQVSVHNSTSMRIMRDT